MKTFDFVVLGGGGAGLAAASHVAGAGRSVAVADPGPIGGLCALRGCNPKKVLVRAAEVLDVVRRAGEHGIRAGEPTADWSAVVDRKERFTSGASESSRKALEKKKVPLLEGSPRFTGEDTLEVGGEPVRAKGGTLVATGSTPRPLACEGGELAATSDGILELREPPRRMVVVGAGVIAFEFAHVFARLGTATAMLARGGQALSGRDPEIVDALVEHTRSLGVRLATDAKVTAIRRKDGALAVTYETRGKDEPEELAADVVLNATGRVPAVEGLDLEKASVATGEHGGILTDDYLRSTTNRRVFAAGDVRGTLLLSPVASSEGRAAARNFLEGDVEQVDHSAVPQVVHTIPQLATVGLTAQAARQRGYEVEAELHDMKDWNVYSILGERPACGRVVVDKATGRILGAHLLGHAAGEQIHLFALAMRLGARASDLKDLVFAYPTPTSTLAHLL